MVKSERQKEIGSKEWGEELSCLSEDGVKALQNAEMSLCYNEVQGSNHEKISQSATAAVRFLNQFEKSLGYVTSIIDIHKKWLEVVPYCYRATGFDFSGSDIIKIDFQGRAPEAENFSLYYQRGNRRWGHTLAHGDLVVSSGMSSHYLEGITDILNVFIESNYFDDLINKDRYKYAHSCFDFPKIHKQCDRDKLYKLLNDTTFLNLIKDNKLREVLDSYSVYQQSQSARKTNIHLKNIMSKTCAFNEMPLPPGAFCKAKDTANMGKKSGIYFGWRCGACFYVGRSSHIENRLKAHHVIGLDDDISWLEMSIYDTHINENFYIWLLQPESNGEIKAAERSKKSEDIEPPS